MQVSLSTQIKSMGLAVVLAAFAYQPAIQANAQAQLRSFERPTSVAIANAAATKQQTRSGSFVDSDGHATSGGARIVEENGRRYLELDASFRSDSGPDLFVLLHSDAVPGSYSPDDYVNLGRIQSFSGAQRYAIPAGVDLSQLQSAVIWCQQFNVTFGYATL